MMMFYSKKIKVLIYNDNFPFCMLNEALEYRKILSFQTCSMLNQANPSTCTLQAGGAVWSETV